MRNISDAVRQLVETDAVSYDALLAGTLNHSAYAKVIRTEVETACKKPVQAGTVVTALTRLRRTLARRPPVVPAFSLKSLAIKTGIVDWTLPLSPATDTFLRKLAAAPRDPDELLMTVSGTREVAIVCSATLLGKASRTPSRVRTTSKVDELVALTAVYDSSYKFVPSVGYALLRAFALRRINVMEVVSTFSDVTFVVSEADAATSLEALRPFLRETPAGVRR
jgi:hypothetical protein